MPLVAYLSLAVAAISMTTSKAEIFRTARIWIDDRSEWLGELVRCPYCTSHWLAFGAVLIYEPALVNSGFHLLDLFLAAMTIVALSTMICGLMFTALLQIAKGR